MTQADTVPTGTYKQPKDGWVCYHCGERFTTPGSAEEHFGSFPSNEPACRIKAGHELGLVMEIRRLEGHNRRLREEKVQLMRRNQTLERQVEGLTGEVERRNGHGV